MRGSVRTESESAAPGSTPTGRHRRCGRGRAPAHGVHASLIAAVDAVPARLGSSCTPGRGDCVECGSKRLLQESESPVFAGDERPDWEDVEVLAASEGVDVRATTAPTVFRCRFRAYIV